MFDDYLTRPPSVYTSQEFKNERYAKYIGVSHGGSSKKKMVKFKLDSTSGFHTFTAWYGHTQDIYIQLKRNQRIMFRTLRLKLERVQGV